MKKKVKKEHKKSYDQVNSPDSIWNRSSAQRGAVSNKKSFGAKEIQKILGIEDEEGKSLLDKDPLKMMDVVYDMWDAEDDEEEEED
jgi:hypothetical protein